MVEQLNHVFLALGLVNGLLFVLSETLTLSVVDWFIPSSTQKMDQETLKGLLRRSVRDGSMEDVKKYIAAGASLTEGLYDVAMGQGHKDIVEYFHTRGFPDLRSEKLLRMVAHGYNALAANAIKAGAVPTAEHLAVATEAMRSLLEKAMGAPAPVPAPDEYRIPVELVFTRTGKMYVSMPDLLKNVPPYVSDGKYSTTFTYTLTRRTKTTGPADLPPPVLPAPPAGYAAPTYKEPRVLRLRSRKITYV